MKPQQEKEFEELVRSHRATIYSVCYMYSKDDDEVADMVQDCLLNIWKGLPSFSERSGLGTWIYRVCLNTCISADRKKKSRGEKIRLDLSHDLTAPDEPDGRQARMLRDRISRLGPIDRAIVLLWLENLSYDEIGEIIGISAKNVGVKLYRIKEQLKSERK